MKNALFGVENLDTYLVLGILVFFGLIEAVSGFLSNTKRNFGDWMQEAGSFIVLSQFTKPGIVLAVLFLGNSFAGSYSLILQDESFLLIFPLYILIDDLLQYWYHRFAHEYNFLWKLHRAHHQAEEMGFFVSYRNAALYYIMMPNIWWVGLMTFLGAGKAVALGLIIKQLIIIGSHSTIKWDKFLYDLSLTKPIIAVLQRIIITPAFHHAHHAKSKIDGVGNPNGNFGNMFSIWDQLFGSALFTGKFPISYGLPNDPKEHWTAPILYPFVKSSDSKSELSKGFVKNKTTKLEPTSVELIKGQKYLWCQCGKSQSQPFCDGSHHGSKFQPLLFEAKRDGAAKLCNCKLTKSGPFCDNSHETVDQLS